MKRSDVPESGEGPSETLPEAVLWVSCTRCEKLHRTEQPLVFNPVCPRCAARRSIMRALEMEGSFPLNDQSIDEVLTRQSPGNYALGYMDDADFVVFYVGRSDSDLRQSLHDWVSAPSRYQRYAPARKAAWASDRSGLMPGSGPALGDVGMDVDSSYTHFAYSYAPSPEAAFEKECRNYEDFGSLGNLDNESRPEKSTDSPELEHGDQGALRPGPT